MKYLPRLWLRLRVAGLMLFLLVGLTACSASRKSATLVNPHTGSTARCDLLTGDMVEKCVQAAEKRGYVQLEKLTSQQRVELENRGFLLLDDLTAEQRGDIVGRGATPQKPAASIP